MERPNLIFVFADQMRAFSCGYRDDADPVITPHLDRFATQSTTLTHAVSNFPVCSPYRAMLMTGCYPLRNGVTGNCNSQRPGMELRERDVCLTDALAGGGYSVGYIGKWHLEAPHEPFVMPVKPGGTAWNEYTPPHRRHGIGYWHGYNTYDNHLRPEYWIGDAPRDRRTVIDHWSPEHETDTAIRFLQDRSGAMRDTSKPFALFVSHNPPHTPFHLVPRKYVERYGDAQPADLLTRGNVDLHSDDPNARMAREHVKNHFAMVTGVDEQFGRLLAAVDELDLADRTLVVFCSDHGEMMGSQNLMHKSVVYDESFRVPFIVRMPGVVPQGRSDDLLLGAPDIAPTLLGLLGVARPTGADWEGSDYSGLLRGHSGPRPESAYFINCPARARGVRTHRYTITRTLGQIRQDRGVDVPMPCVALFDNLDDPYQTRNLAEDRPAVVRDLDDLVQAWLRTTNDPWPDE